jgi:hypothetical protein
MKVHPNFKGKVCVLGHSLGSVILFDLLVHQFRSAENEIFIENFPVPKLELRPQCFVTFGSPLAFILAIRGQRPSESFCIPFLEEFFNIFHPNDPVAYRMEPFLQSAMQRVAPVTINNLPKSTFSVTLPQAPLFNIADFGGWFGGAPSSPARQEEKSSGEIKAGDSGAWFVPPTLAWSASMIESESSPPSPT